MSDNAVKVALVTGASSGIGQATALILATKGYRVYAAARRLDRLEAMQSSHLIPLQLDVTIDNSIANVLRLIDAKEGHLDVLINAAGYGLYGTFEEVTPEEARRQFDSNVFGLARVTQLTLPFMRRQKSGRIINLSSVAGKISTPLSGWYSASKYAVEALSDALRLEVAGSGIHVVLIEPGAIKTEFDEVAFDQLEKTTHLDEYRPLVASFSKLLKRSYQRAPGPELVANTIVQAVQSRHPRSRYALPNDSRMSIAFKRILGDKTFDRLILSQMRTDTGAKSRTSGGA